MFSHSYPSTMCLYLRPHLSFCLALFGSVCMLNCSIFRRSLSLRRFLCRNKGKENSKDVSCKIVLCRQSSPLSPFPKTHITCANRIRFLWYAVFCVRAVSTSWKLVSSSSWKYAYWLPPPNCDEYLSGNKTTHLDTKLLAKKNPGILPLFLPKFQLASPKPDA